MSQPHTLDRTRDAIVTCERCPRLRAYCAEVGREKRRAYQYDVYWARPVPGFGDPGARLLIVGLAPAAHGANRTGRMFTGDGVGGSGDFLMSSLQRTGFANIATSQSPDDGLRLRDAFLTAAVRCAPPDNKPTPDEIVACQDHLYAERDALSQIRVIVALGRIAFDASVRLIERESAVKIPRPRFAHAARHVSDGGITLIGCYHPSRQNTHTGRLTPRMMDSVFRRAAQIVHATS